MAAFPEQLRGRWNHNTHYYRLALDVPPAERVIDVGCGDGLLPRLLAGSWPEVVGVDPWTPADACADLPNVTIVRADFLTADLPAADLVVSFTALHHLDTSAALERMARLVRPGGRLVVVGVARYTPWSWVLGGFTALPHRVAVRRRGLWQHPAPVAEPTETLGEIRAMVRRVMPDAVVRRRLYWRYSIVWQRPG